MSIRPFAMMAGLVALLAGCGDEEVILQGERLDLRADLSAPADATTQGDLADGEFPNRAAPISLGAPVVNASWTHRAGSPAHTIRHPQLSRSLSEVWSADIGEGNTRRSRLTADPVVLGNRVFVLDSRATVTALSTGGQILWSRDLTPPQERSSDASGGGLAVAGNTLFVTTGFGQLQALDTATGATRWVQQLDAAATGAPTVSGNFVVVVSRDNRAWGVDTGNGRVRWELPGVRSAAGLVGGPAAAIDANRVVLPFSSGQVNAVTLNDGALIWNTTIAGRRIDSSFARILDVSGDPVISGSTVFVGNSSGRLFAANVGTGERFWTAEVGAQGPVSVAGGSVFLVSDDNAFLRLDAATGERVWGIELPFRRDVRRLRRVRDVYVHHGPVLAGGRFLIASDDGILRSFDPVDGRLISAMSIGAPAARPPVIAGGTMYLVTADGVLRAFR